MTDIDAKHNSADDSDVNGSDKFKISTAFSVTGRMKITTYFGTIYAYGGCPHKHSKLLSIPGNPYTFLLLPSYEHITTSRPRFVTIGGNLSFTKSDAKKVCTDYSYSCGDESVADVRGRFSLNIEINEINTMTTKNDYLVDVVVIWSERQPSEFYFPHIWSPLPWLQFNIVYVDDVNQPDKSGKFLLAPIVWDVLQNGKQY